MTWWVSGESSGRISWSWKHCHREWAVPSGGLTRKVVRENSVLLCLTGLHFLLVKASKCHVHSSCHRIPTFLSFHSMVCTMGSPATIPTSAYDWECWGIQPSELSSICVYAYLYTYMYICHMHKYIAYVYNIYIILLSLFI